MRRGFKVDFDMIMLLSYNVASGEKREKRLLHEVERIHPEKFILG